jgi:putative sigma-54 modulation protein
MNHNLKGTNLTITPELRAYAEKKLEHANKFLESDPTAHADIELEYMQVRDGSKYRAEFTVSATGTVYRAEQWGETMHAAIDLAVDELVKELRRNKKKRLHLLRHGAGKVKDFLRGFRKSV